MVAILTRRVPRCTESLRRARTVARAPFWWQSGAMKLEATVDPHPPAFPREGTATCITMEPDCVSDRPVKGHQSPRVSGSEIALAGRLDHG